MHNHTDANSPIGDPRGVNFIDSDDPLQALLPLAFRSSPDEPVQRHLYPWFWKSIDVVGDVCIFGDPTGLLSLQFAFALGALLVRKTKNVFCFDYFGDTSQTLDDRARQRANLARPSDAWIDLTAWSRVLPVRAIDGDGVETCKLLTAPISLAWFDGHSEDDVCKILDIIAPLIDPRGIIGIIERNHSGINGDGSLIKWLSNERFIELQQNKVDNVRFFQPVAA